MVNIHLFPKIFYRAGKFSGNPSKPTTFPNPPNRFITKTKIDSQVAVIHKHLLPNLKSQTNTWGGPVILLVDPTLNNDKINLLGYVSQANRMFRECFALFRPVKVDVELFDTSLSTGNPCPQPSPKKINRPASIRHTRTDQEQHGQQIRKIFRQRTRQRPNQHSNAARKIRFHGPRGSEPAPRANQGNQVPVSIKIFSSQW